MPPRFLILGQGLAGTLLSHELLSRGAQVRVLDTGGPSSSKAAAGLFSPVSGQRTALAWNAGGLLGAAARTYAALEGLTGRSLYHPLPLQRIFTDQAQRELYLARAAGPAHAPWLGALEEPKELKARGIDAPFGGMRVKGAGWVDVQGLLDGWRERLKQDSLLDDADGNVEKGWTTLHCTGASAAKEGPFSWLPFQPTKGESLVAQAQGPDQDAIYYGGRFTLPLGNSLWRCGSTFDRVDLDPSPTEAGQAAIEAGASAMLGPLNVQSRLAGIRPNILGHFPVLGRHPAIKGHYVFNGLGSKGVMWGPWAAGVLADHLLEGKEIPAGVNVGRFFKFYGRPQS